MHGRQGADPGQQVGGEYRSRPFGGIQELQARLVAALARIGTNDVDEGSDAGFLAPTLEAGAPPLRGIEFVGIADEGQALVTGLDQRPGGEHAGGEVVDRDATADFGTPIDEDVRDRIVLDRGDDFLGAGGNGDDQAVDAPLADQAAINAGRGRLVVDVGNQHHVADFLGAPYRASDDRGIDRIHQVGQQDAKRPGAAGPEVAGIGVGRVVQPLRGIDDRLPGFGANANAAAAQHLRDGRHINLERLGDILQRRRAGEPGRLQVIGQASLLR